MSLIKISIDMLVILGVGAVAALIGNQFQPEDGKVVLDRQYYEAEARAAAAEKAGTSVTDDSATTKSGGGAADNSRSDPDSDPNPADPAPADVVVDPPADDAGDPPVVDVEMPATYQGFTVSTIDDVMFFSAPGMEQDAIIIDVRHPSDYEEGHIPGAVNMSARKMPETFPEIQDLVLGEFITEVIVYCNGGDCSDSVSAAIFLEEQGVPLSNLRVYKGGIKEWRENQQPIVKGKTRR